MGLQLESCGQWCNISKYACTIRSLTRVSPWPSLFLIYIDGITSIPISSGTQTVLYADDLLFCRISWQEDFTTLQRDIMAIEQWVLDNHLTFNTSKCNYMMLSRKRSPTTPFHPLMLNGLYLNRVECFKYLGVLLSSDLSWTPPHYICVFQS